MKIFKSALMVIALFLVQVGVAQDWSDKAYSLVENQNYKAALSIYHQHKKELGLDELNIVGYCYARLGDYHNAVASYGRASEKGSSRASFNLGRLYDRRYGSHMGINSNDEVAKQYYKKAIYSNDRTSGSSWAVVNLFLIYKDEGNMDEAKEILEYAIKEKVNVREAPYFMAHNIYNGKRQFVYYYRISAENGYSKAQYNLAIILQKGTLVEKDLKEAVRWHKKAAEQGEWGSEDELGKCYEELYLKTLDERYLKLCLKYYYRVYTDDNSSGLPRIINLGEEVTDRSGNKTIVATKSPLEEIFDKGLVDANKYRNYSDWLDKVVKPLAAESDVDVNIPQTDTESKSYVLIIANENYKYEHYVPYAENDGETIKKYFENTIGVANEKIHFIVDASLNEMKKEVEWLVENSKFTDKVYLYYSGHGIPATDLSTSYLLPTDGYAKDPETGLDIKWLYSKLGSMNVPCYVFLDACFSGSGRDQQILVESRGVLIKAKELSPQNKTVVFTACQGTEMAYPINEQKHGLFTYYLLKKLQSSKGYVTMGELSDFLKQNVPLRAHEENLGSQTPTVIVPMPIINGWRSDKFK